MEVVIRYFISSHLFKFRRKGKLIDDYIKSTDKKCQVNSGKYVGNDPAYDDECKFISLVKDNQFVRLSATVSITRLHC